MPFFRTLHQKLFSVYFALLILAVTVITVNNLNSSADYLEREISTEMLAHAKLLELAISQSDKPLQITVAKFKNATGARFTIIGANGEVLADTDEDPATMASHLNRPEIRQAASEGVGQSSRYSTTTGLNTKYIAKIIEFGSTEGFIRVSYPLQTVGKLKNEITRQNLLITLVVAVITGAILFWYLRSIIQPVQAISSAAKKVAAGEFGQPLKVTGAEELQELTKSFNKMAVDLSKLMTKLSSERQRIEAIVVSMIDGVIFCDHEGKVTLINPAAEETFQVSQEAALNRSFLEVIRNYDLANAFHRALSEAEPSHQELRLFTPRELIVSVQVTPVYDGAGVVQGAVATIHDITTLRKLEQLRTEFVSNVSHELKTPLTSIRGFTETLLEEELDLETQQRFLGIILSEADRLSRLINDILNLSRLESPATRLHLQQVDLKQTVSGVMQILNHLIEAKGIKVNLDFGPDFPLIEADSDMMAQVFLNLLENAVKYTPAMGGVSIAGRFEATKVIITVSDTGPGIPAKDLPRIFERFYRVEKARSRQAGGTGLGLAIVKHIIERHHGQISVDSRLQQGTTFLITLPITQPSQS